MGKLGRSQWAWKKGAGFFLRHDVYFTGALNLAIYDAAREINFAFVLARLQ